MNMFLSVVMQTIDQFITPFSFHIQEVQGTEKVKNDKREETQQGRAVTLHSGKEQQAETNSIDNEVL